MSENERESGEETIDESGRNPTQQRIDEGGPRLSEVIPEDDDRDDDGAMEGALDEEEDDEDEPA